MTWTSITGWVAGAKFWLIACALTAAVAGATGYFVATGQAEKHMATAITEASAKATKAQSDQDAKDFAVTRADFAKRLAEANRRGPAAATIYKDRIILVPHQEACKVSKDAMHMLNDPDLLAGAQ